ncbi:ABC transporter substrate-binding protein [Streptomyces roseicoloratus]|uniref:ABC transporter substrate-binding protein n=1 Tax=Streptomyces roseicoloratus TaxID=2508722 RepID=UPI001009F14C|nr:ABC transporter substrate-binding protein [Streptomyces roseicoloratus]
MTWRRPLLPALALIPLLAACSAPVPEGRDARPEHAPPGFPYTVTNCGVTLTYQDPPTSAVTLNQHTTEIMLALGLEDSMVGTAYLDDAILPAYRKAYDSVPVLAEEYPSKEELFLSGADFVYGGYASAFDAKAGRGREEMKADGRDSRLNVESCATGRVTFDDLHREITEVGRTFGVPERAEKWNREARATLAATARRLKGTPPVSVFVYDSGDKTAFTAGGKGIGNELITRAGGRNVFADLDKTFGDATWEQVVARKPEVVVIYDYGSTTVEQKKKRLLDDPALREVPAIKNRRFAVLPLSDTVLGVRAPAAVGKLAAQLHPGR